MRPKLPKSGENYFFKIPISNDSYKAVNPDFCNKSRPMNKLSSPMLSPKTLWILLFLIAFCFPLCHAQPVMGSRAYQNRADAYNQNRNNRSSGGGGWSSGSRKLNGYHEVKFEDGTKYKGQWKNDKMHGKGKGYYDNGQLWYDGDWYEDRPHGTGKIYEFHQYHKWENDEYVKDGPRYLVLTYDGQWKHGDRSGYGSGYEHAFASQTISHKYKGFFQDDVKHGKGKWYINDSEVDDKWHLQTVGTWTHGVMERGKYYMYTRDYSDWTYFIEGRNKLTPNERGVILQDGKVGICRSVSYRQEESYVGEVRYYDPEGIGLKVHFDGKIEAGKWEEDSLVKPMPVADVQQYILNKAAADTKGYDDVDVNYWLGRAYYKGDQYKTAIPFLKKGVDRYPDALNDIGWASYLIGDYEMARDYSWLGYEKTESVCGFYNTALAYLCLGEKTKAIELYRQGKDFGSSTCKSGAAADLKDLISKGKHVEDAKAILRDYFAVK